MLPKQGLNLKSGYNAYSLKALGNLSEYAAKYYLGS